MRVYTYRDMNFDIADGVFYSTETTVAILEAVGKHFESSSPRPNLNVLDLGCGCGVIGIAAAKRFGLRRVAASDLSGPAVIQARKNAKKFGVQIDFQTGSLFEPWAGTAFDVIIDDISGVAEPIARLSEWYPPGIPCATGDDGSTLIGEVLREAPRHLAAGGILFFPVLTLSNEQRILEIAREQFTSVEQVADYRWFLQGKLLERREEFWPLVEQGKIGIVQVKDKYMWHTKVYKASV